MLKRFILTGWFVLAAGLLAGCASRVSVNEILQQPVGGGVYTRYNIFYTDPADISSLNIQKGRTLPVGSKVEIVKATEAKIEFKDEAGVSYQLDFDAGLRMCGIRDYVRDTFSLLPLEAQLKDIRPEVVKYIMRGEVVPGMSRREVMLAYGPPAGCMTPTLKNNTWFFWSAPEQSFRVIFRNDQVTNIINMNE